MARGEWLDLKIERERAAAEAKRREDASGVTQQKYNLSTSQARVSRSTSGVNRAVGLSTEGQRLNFLSPRRGMALLEEEDFLGGLI